MYKSYNVDPKTRKISTGKSEDKFGIPNSKVINIFQKYTSNKFINIVGLSIHIGSQIQNIKPFEIAFKQIKDQIVLLEN